MLHSEVFRFGQRAGRVEADNVEKGKKLRVKPRRKSRWSSRMVKENKDLPMLLKLVSSNFVDGGSKIQRPVFHFHAVRGERVVGLYLE